MKKLVPLLVFTFVVQLSATPCYSDEVYTFIVKKQEEKKKARWSLNDWLETKEKMKLMDLWLALHSPSPYEFFLDGSFLAGKFMDSDKTGFKAKVAAYASIFGLQFDYERFQYLRMSGTFNLRIFGYHNQGTHITLFGGLNRIQYADSTFNQGVAGIEFELYLVKFFGFHFLGSHSFDSGPVSFTTAAVQGNRFEGGGFIDFSLVRIYLNYVNENLTALNSVGAQFGMRLFF